MPRDCGGRNHEQSIHQDIGRGWCSHRLRKRTRRRGAAADVVDDLRRSGEQSRRGPSSFGAARLYHRNGGGQLHCRKRRVRSGQFLQYLPDLQRDRSKAGAGGCPISRAKYKKDVQYLADGDLQRYRDQLLSLPLATWRYRDSPAGSRLHLGFMIDGHESLVCVEPERDQIDLYGYASMAVATLQLQARQIEALQKGVDALRAGLAAPRAARADAGARARQ